MLKTENFFEKKLMMELCFFPDDFGVDDFGVLKGGVSSEEDLEGIFSSETSSSSVYSSKSAYKY